MKKLTLFAIFTFFIVGTLPAFAQQPPVQIEVSYTIDGTALEFHEGVFRDLPGKYFGALTLGQSLIQLYEMVSMGRDRYLECDNNFGTRYELHYGGKTVGNKYDCDNIGSYIKHGRLFRLTRK